MKNSNDINKGQSIDKLKKLFKKGLESKDHINFSQGYNFIKIFLISASASFIGVIFCYLIYIYC